MYELKETKLVWGGLMADSIVVWKYMCVVANVEVISKPFNKITMGNRV